MDRGKSNLLRLSVSKTRNECCCIIERRCFTASLPSFGCLLSVQTTANIITWKISELPRVSCPLLLHVVERSQILLTLVILLLLPRIVTLTCNSVCDISPVETCSCCNLPALLAQGFRVYGPPRCRHEKRPRDGTGSAEHEDGRQRHQREKGIVDTAPIDSLCMHVYGGRRKCI